MSPTRRGSLVALVAGFVALLVLAAPVAAQDGPYGSTSTTRPTPGPRPSCRLSEGSVTPGSTTAARVNAVPRGSTVRIFFDGEQVAEAQADGPGSSPQVNIVISYTVPDVEPGSYRVTATGPTFTASCGDQRVEGQAEVAGAAIERDPDGSGGGSGVLGGSLPRTGLVIGMLVAVGLALVLGGRALLDASRKRGQTARL